MSGSNGSLSLKPQRMNTGRVNRMSSSTAKPLQSAALSHIRTVTKADFTPDLKATGFSRPDMRASRNESWNNNPSVSSLEYSTLKGGWHEQTARNSTRGTSRSKNLFAPKDELLRGTDRTHDSWASDMKRMHKQKEREKAITDGHKGVNKELPDYLKTLVDVDGDGQIDPEEMALMKELEHVEVRDVDGDGQISAEEIMLARKMAGKKLLAERFVKRQDGRLNRFGQELTTAKSMQSNRAVTKHIADHKAFGVLYNALRIREAQCRLSSSDLMTGCLNWNKNRPAAQEDCEIRKFL